MTQLSQAGASDGVDCTPAERYGWALQLMQYEIQRLWVVFGTFLLAETVLLGAVAQLVVQGARALGLAGALMGFVLVIPWWAAVEYARAFYLLRVAQAKELEPHSASLLTEGHALSQGVPVKGVRVGLLVRYMRLQRSGYFLMLAFAAQFALMGLLAIWQ